MNEKPRGIGEDEDLTPSVNQGKNYLLAIGINEYADCPKLYNAVNDVQQFADLLQAKYGFDKAQTQVLRDKEATSDRILEAMKALVRMVQPNDNVIIYFSGHGELDDVLDEGYWIPVEAKRGRTNQYISNSTVQKVLLKINSFHTFLIVDSCYSGAFFLDRTTKFVSAAYDFPSRWGLTSGRNTIVSDGKAGTNSPFAKALLETLERADKPLNVSALCDIVKQTVPAATNNFQKPIGDPLLIEGHKGGQFILKPKTIENQEEKFWQAVIKQNTEHGYSEYLREYPTGQYALQATVNIKTIIEEKKQSQSIKASLSLEVAEVNLTDYNKSRMTSENWRKIMEDIVFDIKDGMCAIILGPEMMRIDQPLFKHHLNDYIRSLTEPEDILFYNEHDNLFLFKDNIVKDRIKRRLTKFYRDYSIEGHTDEKKYLNLVRLPVPIILSVNPDTNISDVAHKYGIKHNFSFYSIAEQDDKDLQRPTMTVPLFYNLCGSISNSDSLILDPDDSVDLINSLLGNNGLPNYIKYSLEKIHYFLLIGFNFDRWYSQVFTHLVGNKSKSQKKIALFTQIKDSNSAIFLDKQYNIKFISDGETFLNELHDICESQGILRNIIDAQTPLQVRISQLIQNDKISEALDFVATHLESNEIDTDDRNTITLFQGRYNNLERQKRRGTIDDRDYKVQINQIIYGFLEWVESIK